jgi:methyl-accepting chemotaxis protein
MVFDRLTRQTSVRTKLAVVLGVMLLLAVSNVAAVYYYVGQTEQIGNSVNTAGEQRMLTQKMARYVAQVDTGNNIAESREALRAAADEYQSNLETLENGGTANGAQLNAAPSAVTAELRAEKQLWNEYRQRVETVLTAEPGSPEFRAAADYVQANSNELLVRSDDLTSAFAAVSQSRMAFMQQLLLVLLAVDVIVFAGGLVYTQRVVATPIRELADTVEALRAGQFGDNTGETDADGGDDSAATDEVLRASESVERLEQTLDEIFTRMEELSSGLQTGEFDSDVQTTAPGTYGDVMEQLDAGTDELDQSFREIRSVSVALQAGQVDATVDTDRPGAYGEVLSELSTGMGQLSRGFDEISTASERLQAGRLDQPIQTDHPGALGETLDRLEDAFGTLDESLQAVQAVADETAQIGTTAADSVREIEAAGEAVVASVEEVSTGADSQRDTARTVRDEMNELSATVEEIASSAEEVAAVASTAAEKSETGQARAANATEQLELMQSQATEVAASVESLDEEVSEVGSIVEVITDIAEQTNMLALNASIEAARAGKHGDGFGVVASEIKDLAEDVSDATTDIEARIDAVQAMTTETTAEMDAMSERIDQGASTIRASIDTFDEISVAAREAESGIEEISAATDEQAASSEEVVAMMDEVSAVSEQAADEAAAVLDETRDQTALLSELSTDVASLGDSSDRLQRELATFDLGRGGVSVEAEASASLAQPDGGAPADTDGS